MRRIGFVSLVLLAAACAEPMGEPESPSAWKEPPWLVVRVDAVEVTPLRPGTQVPWDDIEPQPTDGTACGMLGRAMATTDPITGKGAEALCAIDPRPRPPNADARLPDLVVLLGVGSAAHYQTPTAHDTMQSTFNGEFVIPTNSIPPEGITLVVVDRDGTGAEVIGGVKLGRQELLAAQATRPVFSMRGGGVLRMDLAVMAYTNPMESTEAAVTAQAGGALVSMRPIRAGEVVEISARGQYRIGTGRGAWIDPRGYFEKEPHDPNFENEPFRSAPHGAGIAVVGGGDARMGAIVAPCARFVARTPGLVWVGLNDAEPRNNEGNATFTVKVAGPLPAEWSEGKSTTPCGTFP
ncbi:C2 domain-containing protein [Polyangium sp. 6x1]|uniref:C2 domain-containing protein n=1 Tax=Polyangium sp. 6x1 TaxID=3042689 RepID=UPI002482BA9F|nr:C2 domain-containing protein [Polyangium sp. 6x1]MDI1444190.1 C2 domain-containing protein [Polyangium sp. 6x1]